RGSSAPVLRIADISLDIEARRARRAEEVIELTAMEWAVIAILAGRPGRIYSRSEIESHLAAQGLGEADSNSLEVIVSRLRKKLDAAAISTHRGLGYRLEICLRQCPQLEPGEAASQPLAGCLCRLLACRLRRRSLRSLARNRRSARQRPGGDRAAPACVAGCRPGRWAERAIVWRNGRGIRGVPGIRRPGPPAAALRYRADAGAGPRRRQWRAQRRRLARDDDDSRRPSSSGSGGRIGRASSWRPVGERHLVDRRAGRISADGGLDAAHGPASLLPRARTGAQRAGRARIARFAAGIGRGSAGRVAALDRD